MLGGNILVMLYPYNLKPTNAFKNPKNILFPMPKDYTEKRLSESMQAAQQLKKRAHQLWEKLFGIAREDQAVHYQMETLLTRISHVETELGRILDDQDAIAKVIKTRGIPHELLQDMTARTFHLRRDLETLGAMQHAIHEKRQSLAKQVAQTEEQVRAISMLTAKFRALEEHLQQLGKK